MRSSLCGAQASADRQSRQLTVRTVEKRKARLNHFTSGRARPLVVELLLDSFRLAGTNSVMLMHVALLEQMLGTVLGVSGQLTGREIPGAAPEVQRS